MGTTTEKLKEKSAINIRQSSKPIVVYRYAITASKVSLPDKQYNLLQKL